MQQEHPTSATIDGGAGSASPPPVLTTVPWKSVVIFVVLAMALAWLVVLPLWVGGNGLSDPLAPLLLPLMMFTPLISTVVVVFFVQKPRPHPLTEFLGMWPLKPVGRTLGMVVIGILGGAGIVIAGVFLSAALGLVELDLVNFSGFAAVLEEAGAPTDSMPISLLVVAQLLALPIGAVINGVLAFGEELGWRGWLLPSLRPLGTWPALLLSGAIFGLWHTPIILLGYNFNEPNLFGVALMTVAATLLGVLLGWLRLRSASVWPAVFAHGAINAAAGFIGLVIAADSTVDLVSSGPLGWVTWIVMALVIVVLILTGQFSKQPHLQHATPSRAPNQGR